MSHCKCHIFNSFTVLILFFSLGSSAFAQTFTWEDENGLHATNNPNDLPQHLRPAPTPVTQQPERVITTPVELPLKQNTPTSTNSKPTPKKKVKADPNKVKIIMLCNDWITQRKAIMDCLKSGDTAGANAARAKFKQTNNKLDLYPQNQVSEICTSMEEQYKK